MFYDNTDLPPWFCFVDSNPGIDKKIVLFMLFTLLAVIGGYLTLLHDNDIQTKHGGEGLIRNFKFCTSLIYKCSGKQLQAFYTKDSIFFFVCIVKCLIDSFGL